MDLTSLTWTWPAKIHLSQNFPDLVFTGIQVLSLLGAVIVMAMSQCVWMHHGCGGGGGGDFFT